MPEEKKKAQSIWSRPPAFRPVRWGDVVAYCGVAVLLYAGVRLAVAAPSVIRGPQISLSPRALPVYALLSLTRMALAYSLSLVFTLVYGYEAARNRRSERFLIPLLDVLQSVPILSFLPLVLLGLSAVLPVGIAAEIASIVLIFTSQAWNLTFSWYQSLTTVPHDLVEASTIFRLNGWLRFRLLELPFATISLLWNSMMSWAGGWFFLMAAEIFTVGKRDFRLPGLGAYLQEAANQGNLHAIGLGIGVLVLLVVGLDQLVWRPLLAWADRFKIGSSDDEESVPTSWFYDVVRGSATYEWIDERVATPFIESIDRLSYRIFGAVPAGDGRSKQSRWQTLVTATIVAVALIFGMLRAAGMVASVPLYDWGQIALAIGATFLRVAIALTIALAWTIPVGVALGTNARFATWLQPILQILASVPATALFPVMLLFLVRFSGGLNFAAVLLMLLGTQWYLLFNVVAGASSIPQDLKYTASLMQLGPRERWKTLTLPALFPYVVTGAITASGGAWNASIVAEYAVFGGKVLKVRGVGSLIAQATASGNYPLLLAATSSMILVVVVINRLVWRPLYEMAETRFRME
jgi:NitT/TauT family transport system permease protein